MLPLINGIARSWSQITLPFLGVPLSGITKISWSSERVKDDNYGAGSYASSRGVGNFVFTGSISMLKEEYDNTICKGSPNNDPTRLPFFDLPILFLDETNGSLLVKTVWKSCEIKKVDQSPGQGDTGIMVDIEFMMADIQNTNP